MTAPGPTPRVTVVTIFHDPGPHFEEAIRSVLGQTFQDFEYLLVDDGSTDGSSEVARQTAAEHPGRVHYVEHPGHVNRGMSASRNLGIQHARGELIASLDADDMWLPDALERQLSVLDGHPEAQMVIGASVFWHSWNPEADESDVVYRVGRRGLRQPPELAVGILAQKVNPPSMNACVSRREALLAVGGYEESFTGLFEDQAFLFKFLLEHPAVVHDQVVDRYRQHDASACAVGIATGTYVLDGPSPARLAFYDFARRYVDTSRWRGSPVRRAARRAESRDRHPRRTRFVKRWGPCGLRRRAAGRLRRWRSRPPVRDLGQLRRLRPFSNDYGYDRGRPVDRYYIERFYATYGADIRGRVLEVGDDTYSRAFGGELDHVDVLHVDPADPQATVVADLASAPQIPDATYDCVVIAQTLHLIPDLDAAVSELRRIVRPGGIVLATVPGITRMTDGPQWQHHWSLTEHSARRLFDRYFDDVLVDVRGNVLAATAFLYGMAEHELTPRELDKVDNRFPVTITVRALRAARS